MNLSLSIPSVRTHATTVGRWFDRARVTAPVIDWQFPALAKLVTEAETNNYIIVVVLVRRHHY